MNRRGFLQGMIGGVFGVFASKFASEEGWLNLEVASEPMTLKHLEAGVAEMKGPGKTPEEWGAYWAEVNRLTDETLEHYRAWHSDVFGKRA